MANVIVTGAGRGLGRAVAELFYNKGWKVTAVGLHEENLKSLAEEAQASGRMLIIAGDVSKEEDCRRFFDLSQAKFGTVDALVNCAGSGFLGRVVETTLEQWNRTFEVNATGTFLMCREALQRWRGDRHKGVIVNVSSVSAHMGAPLASTYAASKAAVIAFSRSIARETAGAGIRVNVVCPGAMNTDMFHKDTVGFMAEKFKRDSEQLVQSTLSAVPMHRLVEPEEAAQAVFFLCSEEASAITGQTFNVDCGYDMR